MPTQLINHQSQIDWLPIFLPMASYTNISPLSVSPSYPYVTPIDRQIILRRYSIAAYVAGTNNGTNYWTFDLQFIAGGSNVTAATVNTSAVAATTWTLLTTTSFTYTTLTSSNIRLLVTATKTGTPADVYLSGAIAEVSA